MNTRAKLIASIAIVTGTIGLSSLAIANSRNNHQSTSTIAQNSSEMNHGGMNHDGMKKGGMMNHDMDVGPADANYDLRFLDSMIPHHQGALVMAQEVLAKSKRPELIKLANGIITDQKKEISQMKKLAQNIIKSQQAEIDLMTQWQKEWSVTK